MDGYWGSILEQRSNAEELQVLHPPVIPARTVYDDPSSGLKPREILHTDIYGHHGPPPDDLVDPQVWSGRNDAQSSFVQSGSAPAESNKLHKGASDEALKIPCGQCGKVYNGQHAPRNLARHVADKHPVDTAAAGGAGEPNGLKERVYRCPVCAKEYHRNGAYAVARVMPFANTKEPTQS
ncbi:hypothetical protein EJ04DRAFT_573136 [Polyplosphaeria fusca]|uniref:Uncharacterized protein n=1 Tax=Polyplosphaeria fusca TaxID=682080 RepID=A0A9P4R913_9PLEO|nr:hypothetical protein EJ04DRAFT_573136 [Polyplosphaeria fusca]